MSVWGVGQRLVVDVACRMQGSAVCSTWPQPTMEVCHGVGSVICCGPLLRLRAKGFSVSKVVFTVQSRLARCWQLLHPHQKGSLRAGLACCWGGCVLAAHFSIEGLSALQTLKGFCAPLQHVLLGLYLRGATWVV